ncbi:MAG: hypothetical protein IB618_00925 [Candidatus Pacearchaeota archaeon]|nr:MAG: hypothetical protein IB618_00925 [Candidatus Pacearchaeota archaeon]
MVDEKKETSRPNIPGFQTEEELLAEMLGGANVKRHTVTRYEKKIPMSREQIESLNLAASKLSKLWPGYEIETSFRDSVNVSTGYGMSEVVPATSYFTKWKGKLTQDKLSIGYNEEKNIGAIKFEADGNREIRDTGVYYLSNVINLIVFKGRRLDESNLDRYTNPLIKEALEILRKDLEPVRTNRTIQQVIENTKIDEPERLKCEPKKFDFLGELGDLVGYMDNLVAEKGGFAGMSIVDQQYEAPDNKNAGEIIIKKRSEISDFVDKYQLSELGAIAKGAIIINALLESRIDEALALAKYLPDNYKEKVYSIVEDIQQNYSQNNKLNQNNLKGG